MSSAIAPTILLVTPFLADANNGNWRTAVRWARLLPPAYRTILQAADAKPGDRTHDRAVAMIALHARRSRPAIARWKATWPDRALIVALTGTDLYRDLPAGNADARRSLEDADRLIVLQPDALCHLPAAAREKADVIYQSARTLVPFPRKAPDRLHCVFVGHLRDEKDPATLFDAWRRLPRDLPATLSIIGAPLDAALGDAAGALARHDSRVQVLGSRPHSFTRQAIKRAHVLIVPSRMEGGANVVVEAITAGTPVIGSRMSGNVGMLGEGYAGYFDVGDPAGLAGLVERASRDRAFLASLGTACADRARHFAPEAERFALTACVARARERCAGRNDPFNRRTRPMNAPDRIAPVKLTSFSHGGGCGCKIAPAVLQQIISRAGPGLLPKALLVGIETSDDAAVYQLNDRQAIVATTDFFMPIVDDPFDFGAIAATNAISDVYAMGGTPLFALALVGMPINQLPVETIRRVLEGGEAVCAKAGIPIAGGHTIDSVEPIYGLVAIGVVDPKHLKRNAGAKPGDKLVLGKPIGVGVYSAALKKERLSADQYAAMLASTTQLNTPGIALGTLEGVHALTDVTGFGLLGHLLEMCRGSNAGARIDWTRIALHPGVEQLAKEGIFTGASARNWAGYGADVTLDASLGDSHRALLTDPQTSGGLLAACAPGAVDDVMATFRREGFERAGVIGEIVAGPPRVEVRAA